MHDAGHAMGRLAAQRQRAVAFAIEGDAVTDQVGDALRGLARHQIHYRPVT